MPPITKPSALDVFCCQGGVAKGYRRAGFKTIVGIDRVDYGHRYPFRFIQGDAIAYLSDSTFLRQFSFIHASPPCQEHSISKHSHSAVHDDFLVETRELCEASGLPYVIENVEGAPMKNPLMLCGTEFGLTAPDTDGEILYLRRHRLFESNVPLVGKRRGGCRCAVMEARGYRCGGVYGGGSTDKWHARYVRQGGYTPAKSVREALLGIDWMTLYGLSQSIPPAYTEFIGKQILEVIA